MVSVKLHDPQFEGQTKTKLWQHRDRGLVQGAVTKGWPNSSKRTPPAKRIIGKGHSGAQGTRGGTRKAREMTRRKGVLDSFSMPGKSWPTARAKIRRPKSSLSRATRQVDRPKQARP